MAAVDLDYDLLVTRVESTLIEDGKRYQTGFTPQELLARSNTAMFTLENHTPRDLTNPREMYTLLSNRSKSIEDLSEQFKRGLVMSFKTGSLQNLTRAASFHDIYPKCDKEHTHSKRKHEAINSKKLKMTVTENSVKSIEEQSEKVRTWNLPKIAQQTNLKGDKEHVRVRHNAGGTLLPSLQENIIFANKENESPQTKTTKHEAEKVIDVRTEHVQVDKKFDKWFSEMPTDVVDRAKRALMEQNIKEKLQASKKSRSTKGTFPNPNNTAIRVTKQKVHNTFLELRVDTFGKHLRSDNDDKMNKYKLQQKSMHRLKMRENSEVDQFDKTCREDVRLALHHRSMTNLGLSRSKTKPEVDNIAEKPKRESTFDQKDNSCKVFNINDKLAVESKHKHWTSNYEDYTERVALLHALQDHGHFLGSIKIPGHSDVTYYDERTFPLIRENTKASIVNLALDKDEPKARKPKHIEKNMKDVKFHEDQVKQEATEVENPEQVSTEIKKEDNEAKNTKHEQIITKIPTAQSSRTSESKSTSSSILSKTNKEALKKFNMLEVFAESNAAPANDVVKEYARHRRHRHAVSEFTRTLPNTSFHFPVKFDLKHQQRQIAKQPFLDIFQLKELRKPEPEVVFRFEPGEVFIEQRYNKQSYMYNRPSERAKIIYGKNTQGSGVNKVNLNKTIQKDINRDNQSVATFSTKLDLYREDLGRFESRAVDGSYTSTSPRHDGGAQNTMLSIKSNTFHEMPYRSKNSTRKTYVRQRRIDDSIVKYDAATETEERVAQAGPVEGTGTRTPASNQSVISSLTDRSASDLDDFIVENNDGESLESDSEEEIHSPIVKLRSSQSI